MIIKMMRILGMVAQKNAHLRCMVCTWMKPWTLTLILLLNSQLTTSWTMPVQLPPMISRIIFHIGKMDERCCGCHAPVSYN